MTVSSWGGIQVRPGSGAAAAIVGRARALPRPSPQAEARAKRRGLKGYQPLKRGQSAMLPSSAITW